MKKSLLLCGLLTALIAMMASPRMASAANGATAWAPVEMIAAGGTTSPVSYTWFTLSGVASAGTCATTTPPGSSSAKVIFPVSNDDRGKQQLSLIESAFLSGKSVLVYWDTTIALGGFCQAAAVYIK